MRFAVSDGIVMVNSEWDMRATLVTESEKWVTRCSRLLSVQLHPSVCTAVLSIRVSCYQVEVSSVGGGVIMANSDTEIRRREEMKQMKWGIIWISSTWERVSMSCS